MAALGCSLILDSKLYTSSKSQFAKIKLLSMAIELYDVLIKLCQPTTNTVALLNDIVNNIRK